MVHIYYHIYAIDGVEAIIDEQLSLIEKHFDFPYILNVGISVAKDQTSTSYIVDKFYNFQKPNYRIRDIRFAASEWTTLDLIEKDKESFGNSDYILYLHTKGASKFNSDDYPNIESWRKLMNYFNIEKCKDVIRIFDQTDFNTYGCLYGRVGSWILYSGNFWWMKAEYAKSIDGSGDRTNRFGAEIDYIQKGKDWQPYSHYNREGEYHYGINFKREEYAI